MKHFTMPGTEITAPNVVLGLMRIADKTDDDIQELVRTARDAGIDFVDHADVYGNELRRADLGGRAPARTRGDVRRVNHGWLEPRRTSHQASPTRSVMAWASLFREGRQQLQ
ncbi:hypothetical protein [Streptomyces sp. B6B3]|uniref:hypothetical protein n=1 Tax=Streptomyces sp. B6B3 TaxID=3153570 RepID=UPI00325DECAC